jgi:hypothetical protein
MNIRVYLDTCILGMIWDKDDREADAEAIGKLCDHDEIDFVTSKKALEEILDLRNDLKRNLLKLHYRLMEKLPEANLLNFASGGMNSGTLNSFGLNGGITTTDPHFAELNSIFDKSDAEHVFQAVKGECQYFLAVDVKSILRRAPKHSSKLNNLAPNMSFVDPRKLVNILTENNSTG